MEEVTAGSIKALYDNNKKSPLTKHPRVQIINIKSVETNGKTRYRALVSDGIHFMQAMLATQYAPVVEQGKIKRNSIVRLRETVCNELQFRKILIVLELDVVTTDVDLRVGSPIGLESNINPASPVPNTTNGRSMSVASSSSLPSSTISTPSQHQDQQYQQQPSSQTYTTSSFNNSIQYQQQKHDQQYQIKQEERLIRIKQEERLIQQQQQLRSQAQPSSQAYTPNQPFSQSTQPLSQYTQPSFQYNQPSSQYNQPSTQYNQPSTQYNQPSSQYNQPSSQYNQPSSQYNQPSSQYNQPSSQYNQPSTQYSQTLTQYTQPSTQYTQPSPQYTQSSSEYTQSTYDSQPNYPNKQMSGPISNFHSLSSSKSPFTPPNSYSLMASGKSEPHSPMYPSQATAKSVLSSSQMHLSQMHSSQMYSSQYAINRMEAPMLQIKDLTPYIKAWSIKVRLSMKTPVRTWNNAKSNGRLFSVNFVDQSGEIGATGFNDQVTRFYDLLQDDCVYMITKAKIAMNNKRFSNLANDYELLLESGTSIKPCIDDGTIPYMKMDKVILSDLDKYPLHSIVDVMAIVVEDKGMFEVVRRTHGVGKLVYKREVMVVDRSLKKVKFTLWDEEGRDFDPNDKPVIICKGARVGRYEGAYLSTSPCTTIKRNPNHPDAKKLKEWYESIGYRLDYTTFQPIGKEEINAKLPKISINTAIAENFGHLEKPDYFVLRATLTYIKPDNSIYAGCPDCKKKTFVNNGQWWCERCEKFYKEPVWKYILTASINDNTGQLLVNMFDETARRIVGLNAQQFLQLKEADGEAADNIITKALFKTYNFKIRARQEEFNSLYRIKYQIMEINDIDYVKESRALVHDIYGLL